jgi:glycine cleavage system H protein
MFTRDPYTLKAIEYLVGVASLLLFVAFWRFVNGVPAAQPSPARGWAAQFGDWFRVPDGFAFHRGHGWARPDLTGVLTLGIDDFAQQLVGPIGAVHLPRPGTVLSDGARAWSLEAGGKRVDVLAPVGGTVLAVNDEVVKQPTLVNADPYGRGWLLKVRAPRGLAALKELMSPAAARRWTEQVAQRLTATISPELGHVYQDGGTPVHGIARSIDEAHWDEIARRFLLTSGGRDDDVRGIGFSRIDSTDRHVASGFSRMGMLALATLFGAMLAATALAQDMPRLPGPIKMTRTSDSPGQVIFTHATHVDASQPACTACHPREFRILRASPRRVPVTHADMEKGRYCGACHDGKKGFALDDCAACHQD